MTAASSFSQPEDFRLESDSLYELLSPLVDSDFERGTQFKGWSLHDVISHLHAWNRAADMTLTDPDRFAAMRGAIVEDLRRGRPIPEIERIWLDTARNQDRLAQWREFYPAMARRFVAVDPKQRLQWPGPPMSARSSITARLMETWAHGQAAFDLLGVDRVDEDRIYNVAVLGVNTRGWTFRNRKLDTPEPAPHVRLIAPSGKVWCWNDPDEENLIEGCASEFCQVVTQVRNVGDTELRVVGQGAAYWMAMAQCFAGPPQEPPLPGSRYRQGHKG